MASKVTISMKILDGNLGDGWADNYKAAKAYAGYLEAQLTDVLASMGLEPEIDIDVCRNTSGTAGSPAIDLDGEASTELERQVEAAVDHTCSWAWDRWAGSTLSDEYSRQ